MAKSLSTLQQTFTADSDLRTKQYYALKKTTTGVDLAGDGDPVIGILDNKPDAGTSAVVTIYGISPAKPGSTDIAEGDLAAADADGLTVTATTGEHAYGICLEAGDHTSGAWATVLLLPQGRAA